MKVFLDSEFTHFSNPRPISIGLVSEDGREFYREFCDSWNLGECSMFVIGWVLPLLSDGEVGRRLFGLLDKHLDLVQCLIDDDNQFPREKRRTLFQELEREKELDKHFRFLHENSNKDEIKLSWNPFLERRLEGATLQSLLSGVQVESSLQVVTALTDWLSQFGQEVSLVVDSEYDEKLLVELYAENGQLWPRSVSFEYFDWSSKEKSEFNLYQVRESYYHSGMRRHHALDDAQALRFLWLASLVSSGK